MSLRVNLKKEDIEFYLKELAKAYHKLNRNAEMIEVIIVGGGSICINYDFRESTYDVDCFMSNYSILKTAINTITDRYELQNGWINIDFVKTKSFSHKLREYSVFYKKWYSIEYRTIKDEYLIAMKLVAARDYKHDLVDIKGIIEYHIKNLSPITHESIKNAVFDLYGTHAIVSEEMWKILELMFEQ